MYNKLKIAAIIAIIVILYGCNSIPNSVSPCDNVSLYNMDDTLSYKYSGDTITYTRNGTIFARYIVLPDTTIDITYQ